MANTIKPGQTVCPAIPPPMRVAPGWLYVKYRIIAQGSKSGEGFLKALVT